jgi:hypothetical protein
LFFQIGSFGLQSGATVGCLLVLPGRFVETGFAPLKLVSEIGNFLPQPAGFKFNLIQAPLLGLKLFYDFLACLQLLFEFDYFALELRIALGELLILAGGVTELGLARLHLSLNICEPLSQLLVRRVQLLILGFYAAQAISRCLEVFSCALICRELLPQFGEFGL